MANMSNNSNNNSKVKPE